MWLEVGGFVGGLLGGMVTDRVLKGRRGPVMCVFSLVCAPLGLALTYALDAGAEIDVMGVAVSKNTVLAAIYFALGIFSFPPHSLIGYVLRHMLRRAL